MRLSVDVGGWESRYGGVKVGSRLNPLELVCPGLGSVSQWPPGMPRFNHTPDPVVASEHGEHPCCHVTFYSRRF